MNSTTRAVAGRAPARRKTTPPTGSRWRGRAPGPPAPAPGSARRLRRCRPRAATGIDVSLLAPAAQRVRVHPHTRADPLAPPCSTTTRVLLPSLDHEPDRPLSQLLGYFLGAGICSTLPASSGSATATTGTFFSRWSPSSLVFLAERPTPCQGQGLRREITASLQQARATSGAFWRGFSRGW